MRLVLSYLRGAALPANCKPYNRIGVLKYGMAGVSTLLFIGMVFRIGYWWLLPGAVLVFYAVEAQMVFLFPLAIDGYDDVFRQSRQWTVGAGGTMPVTRTTMQLAALMLFGGFLGKGFVRSWALGCLAVVIWYEEVRLANSRIA